MSWQTIGTADVLNEFTAQEAATLNNIQGTTEALAGIIANVVRAIRGSVVAGGNQLGPINTVPDQLRSEVIAIARWEWLTSFPALKAMQTAARKDAATEAKDLLNLIASNQADRPRVEIPDAGTAASTVAPTGAVAVARPGMHVHRHGYGKIGST